MLFLNSEAEQYNVIYEKTAKDMNTGKEEEDTVVQLFALNDDKQEVIETRDTSTEINIQTGDSNTNFNDNTGNHNIFYTRNTKGNCYCSGYKFNTRMVDFVKSLEGAYHKFWFYVSVIGQEFMGMFLFTLIIIIILS